MKKRVLLVFFICFLFLLSGCENKTKKEYEVAAEKVSQEILDTENISISKIEKALNYIINNYETVRKQFYLCRHEGCCFHSCCNVRVFCLSARRTETGA